MSRTYDRDTKHYDRAVLNHLVEIGEASFFETAGVYVVKTEDGTFAVRPHQIVEIAAPVVEESTTNRRPATSWVSSSEQDEILGYFGI